VRHRSGKGMPEAVRAEIHPRLLLYSPDNPPYAVIGQRNAINGIPESEWRGGLARAIVNGVNLRLSE